MLSWSLVAVVFFLLTLFVLSLALCTIDVGIGYAVWAGIGAVGGRTARPHLLRRDPHPGQGPLAQALRQPRANAGRAAAQS
ncbi:DMT family transporter [Amycolatopsis sp. NPDC049868]|uniref:DMT family transporter n=1 Tax=Amycolatopsis sp. NPDC049868 TaxID=3363934 RepID=UPI0037A7FBA3